MKSQVEKTTYGCGVERVAYELNNTLPCLSPLVSSQYVLTPRELLPALERAATSGNRGREPMDRHIAAWCISRDRRSEITFSPMGGSNNAQQRGLAMLNLFADMQSRQGPEKLPGIAKWLHPLLESVSRRFHNRQLQDNVREQLKAASDAGNLAVMAKLLDDPKRVQRDEQEFDAARIIFAGTIKEIKLMERQVKNYQETAIKYGRPAATYVACLIAVGLVIMNIIRAFT
jgi:hypothetical protein